LAALGAGSFFGELSLFLHKPRSATVRTRQATELFVLSREMVERLAEQHAELSEDLAGFARRRLLANVLATSPIFAPFTGDAKRAFLSAFETRLVPAGEVLIREGGVPVGLFVIVEGQVQVTKSDDQADEVVVTHLGPGQVFGEISLIRNDVATASVRATESSMLLQLPRDDFSDILGSRPEARDYLAGLSEARLEELRSAFEASGQVLDADDLVMI
jgi:cAMP-dependent protein kinase regulator